MADDERESHANTWAQFISGKVSAIPGHNPPELTADEILREPRDASAPARGYPTGESSPPASLQTPEGEPQQKQLKTAAELAEMIEMDLARHPDCPKAGFQVTVYGWPQWRAMLTISPAAGGVRNPQEWRDLTGELAERLHKRYDLAWEE